MVNTGKVAFGVATTLVIGGMITFLAGSCLTGSYDSVAKIMMIVGGSSMGGGLVGLALFEFIAKKLAERRDPTLASRIQYGQTQDALKGVQQRYWREFVIASDSETSALAGRVVANAAIVAMNGRWPHYRFV